MKKFVPIFLVFTLLIFSGCKVKNYTPELPAAFTCDAVVSSGDFSFDCEICKTDEDVSVLVLSTSAKSMKMTCSGKELNFIYDDYSYTVNTLNFEKTNAAIVVYQVFDYLNTTEQISVKKIDGGYKYEGKISAGDFILIQNDDNSLKEITMKSFDYSIKFL